MYIYYARSNITQLTCFLHHTRVKQNKPWAVRSSVTLWKPKKRPIFRFICKISNCNNRTLCVFTNIWMLNIIFNSVYWKFRNTWDWIILYGLGKTWKMCFYTIMIILCISWEHLIPNTHITQISEIPFI